MFDPSTLVHSNKVFSIWHEDPCKDGTDNSCDWFGSKKPLSPQLKKVSEAIWSLETILDNRPFYPDHEAHLRFQVLKEEFRKLRGRSKWRLHPRWHVWHWSITIHALQIFKRWCFTRCTKCGGRFKWNESGVGTWSSEGPMWFRSEILTHHKCYGVSECPSQICKE